MEQEISILGSCVSRDPFSYCATPIKINYVARQSIASIFATPESGAERCIPTLKEGGSAFERRNMEHDIQKDAFETFPKNVPLLVDLIDERLYLARVADGMLYTFSPVAVHNSNLAELATEKIMPVSSGKIALLNRSLPMFVDKLRQYTQVIVHKAFFDEDFGPYDPECKAFNLILAGLYEYVIRMVPRCIVIEVPSYLRRAQRHDSRWGVAPMHYEIEYYLRFLCELAWKAKYRLQMTPYLK